MEDHAGRSSRPRALPEDKPDRGIGCRRGQRSQIAPEDPEVLLTAAAFAAERGDFEVARRDLTRCQELDPKNWRISSALALVEKKTGQLDKAEMCLRRSVDITVDREGRSQLLWLLADTLIDDRKWAEAKRVIEELRQNPVRLELHKYLDARIGVGELRWIEARRELESILPPPRSRTGTGLSVESAPRSLLRTIRGHDCAKPPSGGRSAWTRARGRAHRAGLNAGGHGEARRGHR